MAKYIGDIFACWNCYWGDQCPADDRQICEYYDPIGEMQADLIRHLQAEYERRQFANDWRKFINELADAE